MPGKKKPVPPVIHYTEEESAEIAERVREISSQYRGMPEMGARVYEVLLRLTGENGMSQVKVDYLYGCIMALKEGEKRECTCSPQLDDQ